METVIIVIAFVDAEDYPGLASVDLKIDLFKPVPVVDEVGINDLPFEASVEQLPNEIVVWLLVEFDGSGIVHEIDDFKRHPVAEHLWSHSLLQLLNIHFVLALILSRAVLTSLAFVQGSFPTLKYTAR